MIVQEFSFYLCGFTGGHDYKVCNGNAIRQPIPASLFVGGYVIKCGMTQSPAGGGIKGGGAARVKIIVFYQ